MLKSQIVSKISSYHRSYSTNLPQKTYGLLGIGNLGLSILEGSIKRRKFRSIYGYENSPIQLKKIITKFESKLPLVKNIPELVSLSSTLVLCVKPKDIQEVCFKLSPHLRSHHSIVSLVTGATLNHLESWLTSHSKLKNIPIIRATSNIATKVQSGITVACPNQHVNPEIFFIFKTLFQGDYVVQTLEKDIDIATMLIGATPAFYTYYVEAMIKAGIDLGCDPKVTRDLSNIVLMSCGKLFDVQEYGKVREDVATKGGITAEGLKILDEKNVSNSIYEAAYETGKKVKDISNQFKI